MAEKVVQTMENEEEPQHHHYPRFHVQGRRLRRLIHPRNGKTYHIVSGPHEIQPKRDEIQEENPDCREFEVLVQGTDEFVSIIRDIQRHHETERELMLEQHPETLTKYETVRQELDIMNAEMHHLTEHAVALDSTFDKFGYSAQIRTTGGSETNLLRDDSSSHSSAKYDDRSLSPVKFWSRPILKQYFHKGVIWRSPNSSEVACFELFTDLVYVSVIDYLGEAAIYSASAVSFLHYVIVFAISWKVYSNIAMTLNLFEIDDIFLRLSILFTLCCLYGFVTNVLYFFEYTYTAGLSFYLAIQMFFFLYYIGTGISVKMVRAILFYYAFATLAGVAVWIGSIHVEYPRRIALQFVAIVIDLVAFTAVVPTLRLVTKRRQNWRQLDRMLEYVPALNIEHRVERTNAFTSLVFGYSVITILFQNHASFPLNSFLGKGMLALIQAFVFNWIYFEIDGSNIHVHAIRRHFSTSVCWNFLHIPLSGGYILAAATLSRLVIIRDSVNSDFDTLSSTYQPDSEAELDPALAWFYCGGLGVALIAMTFIGACHVHKKLERPRLLKRPRLAVRLCVGIIIICLPLAHLNSLHMIATTTGLAIFCLILDIFGNSCSGDRFFTGGFCKEHKRGKIYTAHCKMSRKQRQQMRKRLEAGEKVTLEEALRRDSESSLESGIDPNADYHGHHM